MDFLYFEVTRLIGNILKDYIIKFLIISIKSLFEIESDITPICPYCEQEIDTKGFLKGGNSVIQKVETMTLGLKRVAFMTTIYFCPHCKKILGINKTK